MVSCLMMGGTLAVIRAVIFDFDGLIVDTESHRYTAWREIFQEHGADLPLHLWRDGVGAGHDTFDPCAYLEACTGIPLDRAAVKERRMARVISLLDEATVLPGVEQYLQDARALGLKVGLASGSSRGWCTALLDRFGLTPCFDVIRSRDDVSQVKPDPEVYHRVLADLGVTAAEALAFEDSRNGALAAKRAGLYCAVVPNPITREVAFPPVDLRLESLAEVSLAEVLAWVELRGEPI